MSANAKRTMRSSWLLAPVILGVLLLLVAGMVLSRGPAAAAQEKDQPQPETKDKPPAKGPATKMDAQKILEENRRLLDKIDKLQERIDRQDEEIRTLKNPKKLLPTNCKLKADLKDNVIELRAEYSFLTKHPNVIVPLGLAGAFLTEENQFDQQNLALKFDKDGYYLEVAKAGEYSSVVFHLKVPLGLRRAGDAGGGDRGFELGLPGAAVTNMSLGLPDSVKEIRWKGGSARMDGKDAGEYTLEKTRKNGRWELPRLGMSKTLDVSWKEAVNLPGSAALPSAKGTITVKLEEMSSLTSADLELKDPSGQTRDWVLFLPSGAEPQVQVPGGLDYKLVPPDGKNQAHRIQFTQPNREIVNVKVEVRTLRKEAGTLLVGPFFVQNAFLQQGTIEVLATPAAVRGQWLSFQPYGEVHRRDIPKGPAGQDVKAKFEYWSMGKGPLAKGQGDVKIPLKIDWRPEKGSVETFVEHHLQLKKLQPASNDLQIAATTTIKVKALSAGVDFLDVQLPRIRPPRLGVLAFCPMSGFPAGIPWAGLAEHLPREVAYAWPGKFALEGESSVGAEMKGPDAHGKAQITFLPGAKEFHLTLKGTYHVPPQTPRFRIDLPRPLVILDRGGKITVGADERIELLAGPANAEEPVPPKVELKQAWDPSSPFLELAWRPFRPHFPAENETDITIRGQEAHLRQKLRFTAVANTGQETFKTGHIPIRVPKNTKVTVNGKPPIAKDPARGLVWVEPAAGNREPLVIEFSQQLPKDGGEHWQVPLAWPEGATQLEATVRVWCKAGIVPRGLDLGDSWHERRPGADGLPDLVLIGSGPTLDLHLQLTKAAAGRLPLALCDKTLIRVDVDEQGNHHYRARYFIQNLRGNVLDVKYPAAAAEPSITLNNHPVNKRRDERNDVIHLDLDAALDAIAAETKRPEAQPLVLTIAYTLPASAVEGDPRWQTVLAAPVLQGDVVVVRVCWLVSLPPRLVSVVAGNDVRLDYRWSWQTWPFGPEPAVAEAELEWPGGRESGDYLSQAFTRRNQDSPVIVHLPRQTWLLVCSGLLLIVGLALHMVPLPRAVFWAIVVILGAGLVAVGFLWPGWIPALAFGAQPGAVVLVLVVGVHWIRRERYRRQVIFMPGFTRLKPGSSLLNNAPGRPREASTVDAPAPASVLARGSSATQTPPA